MTANFARTSGDHRGKTWSASLLFLLLHPRPVKTADHMEAGRRSQKKAGGRSHRVDWKQTPTEGLPEESQLAEESHRSSDSPHSQSPPRTKAPLAAALALALASPSFAMAEAAEAEDFYRPEPSPKDEECLDELAVRVPVQRR